MRIWYARICGNKFRELLIFIKLREKTTTAVKIYLFSVLNGAGMGSETVAVQDTVVNLWPAILIILTFP